MTIHETAEACATRLIALGYTAHAAPARRTVTWNFYGPDGRRAYRERDLTYPLVHVPGASEHLGGDQHRFFRLIAEAMDHR